MLRKISVFTVLIVIASFFFLPSCDTFDGESENPVGVESQDSQGSDQKDEDYVPQKKEPEGPYPFALLPEPSGTETDTLVEISFEEFEHIKSQVPVNPYSDVSVEKERSLQKLSGTCVYYNSRIYIRGYADNGKYVGLNCKEWARVVVRDATGKNIPSTSYNGYGWYWNWSPNVVAWRGPVDMALPGQILQMWWGGHYKPHTAIVLGQTSNGMYWIDSNWYWDKTVRIHWVSYSYFYSRVGWWFSINQIAP